MADYDAFKERQARAANLTDDQVTRLAETVAQNGPRDYPGDTFRNTFGEIIHALASTDPTGRFQNCLRDLGYELHLDVFEGGKTGCAIRPVPL